MALSLLSVACDEQIIFPEIVIDYPNNGNVSYRDEAEKRDESISKTLVKADGKVKQKQKRYDYWTAVYIDFGNGHGTYRPQTPLTFSQAISYNRRGGNIIASTERNAYKLAVAVGYGRPPEWHERHRHKDGSTAGYRRHYHDGLHKGGHIFYV